MACPHVSRSGRSHQQHHRGERTRRGEGTTTPIHYQKISSELRPGTVFVVPAGHPFITMASQDENLEVVCFEINAENNHKFPLAGNDKGAKERTSLISSFLSNVPLPFIFTYRIHVGPPTFG